MSSKWCGAIRVTTQPKAPSAKGRSSARQITSGCMPGAGSQLTTSTPASRSRRATWPPPVATSSAVSEPEAQLTIRSRSSPSRCSGALRYASARSDQSATSQLHGLAGAVQHRRLDVEALGRRVGQDLPALLGVRAVEPDHDRLLDRHPLERREDPSRDLVAAGDPAEDVEE